MYVGVEVELHLLSVSAVGGGGKGKSIPLQALTGPEGSRMLRLPDFKAVGA
jgi:hypothetical protein